MNTQRFRSYPANCLGRDFVLGDIHGAYDMVLQGMRQVRFDKKVDRIFSVGDLIDRGAGSHRALEFLAQPYVYAVRGNHDDDFSTLSLDDMKVLGAMNWNGLKWVLDVTDEKLLAIKEKFMTLPIAIEVATSRGSVGLVHGEVPAGMSWQSFTQALQRGDEKVIESALTGRDRLQSKDATGVAGIGRVFVGHTVQWTGPTKLANVVAIDTGAVFRELKIDGGRGSLTMVNLACHSGVLAFTAEQVAAQTGQDSFVVTHAEEGVGPFGAYAVPGPTQ